jgi:hypothetical protein
MERRVSLRGRTDFKVIAHDGILASHCRGIEVSPTGIVVDRGQKVHSRHERVVLRLEIHLPERMNTIHALARPIWSRGTHQAFRFVRMTDSDRLSLAEHLDLVHLRGALCA